MSKKPKEASYAVRAARMVERQKIVDAAIAANAAKKAAKKVTTSPEPTKPYRCAGYNEQGVENYITNAESRDRGTKRFPWSADLKAQIRRNLNGLHTEDQMRDTLNKTVLDVAGAGLHNAGPIDGGPYGRGPARALHL